MQVLMHFGYWICVKEILKSFRGYLGESEDASSGVLQRSHLSKLSLAHLQCYSDLQHTMNATNSGFKSDKSWLPHNSYVNLEGKSHISVLILWIWLNLWRLYEWSISGSAASTCVCFCESAKRKSRMRTVRMACLDNNRHSLGILPHHF